MTCRGNMDQYFGIHVERQEDGRFLLSPESYSYFEDFGEIRHGASVINTDSEGSWLSHRRANRAEGIDHRREIPLIDALLYVTV